MLLINFELAKKGLWIYRKRDWLVDVIDPGVSKTGKSLHIGAYSQCVDYLKSEYDFSEFPKNFLKYTRNHSDKGVSPDGIRIAPSSWHVDDHEMAVDSMKELLVVIETQAIPWFDEITSMETLLESFSGRAHDNPNSAKIIADMRANAHKYKPLN